MGKDLAWLAVGVRNAADAWAKAQQGLLAPCKKITATLALHIGQYLEFIPHQ